MVAGRSENYWITAALRKLLASACAASEKRMSGRAYGWTPVGPAAEVGGDLKGFCCILLGIARAARGISTGKESGRMVFTS